jgi:hypothetical protein
MKMITRLFLLVLSVIKSLQYSVATGTGTAVARRAYSTALQHFLAVGTVAMTVEYSGETDASTATSRIGAADCFCWYPFKIHFVLGRYSW